MSLPRPHAPTQQSRAKLGFTLVELLVVIGIIALLISILLPALGKAKDQSNLVKCMSNMRQLHNAFVMYGNLYNGYCVPGQASDSNFDPNVANVSTEYWWLGAQTLGRALGIRGESQEVVDRLARLVDCPSTNREKIAGNSFSIDYSYNDNLGNIRGQWPGHPSFSTWGQAHKFKKRTQVPNSVVVLVEAGEPVIKDDERFDALNELTWKKGIAGSPHRKGTRMNALFHDGSVYTIRGWTRPPGMARTLSTAPAGFPGPFTDLRDWMIKDPGHRLVGSVNAATSDDDVWKKGRPLPNF